MRVKPSEMEVLSEVVKNGFLKAYNQSGYHAFFMIFCRP